MRKTVSIPYVAGSMPQRRPVFLDKRPTFRTRRDWSSLLWVLAYVLAYGLGAALVLALAVLT